MNADLHLQCDLSSGKPECIPLKSLYVRKYLVESDTKGNNPSRADC